MVDFHASMRYIFSYSWGIPLNNRMLVHMCQNVEYLPYELTWPMSCVATEHAGHISRSQMLRYCIEKSNRYSISGVSTRFSDQGNGAIFCHFEG
jgi:hypothetical protein